jgi:DUF2934 family protein
MAKKVARKQSPSVKSLVEVEPSHNGQMPHEEEIRFQAYLKWEAAGKPMGDGSNFWMEAEKELLPKK